MAGESEYDGRMIAATKNIESIFLALNRYESIRATDAKRVETLLGTITELKIESDQLRQDVIVMKAKLYSAGIR